MREYQKEKLQAEKQSKCQKVNVSFTVFTLLQSICGFTAYRSKAIKIKIKKGHFSATADANDTELHLCTLSALESMVFTQQLSESGDEKENLPLYIFKS